MFENAHTNEFNMIFVPDCAGVWVDMQMEVQTLESRVLANTVLHHILEMIAVGGILVLSKFLHASFLKMFKEILENEEYIYEELIANNDQNKLIKSNNPENNPGQVYIIIYKSKMATEKATTRSAAGGSRKRKRRLRPRTVIRGGGQKSRRSRARKRKRY